MKLIPALVTLCALTLPGVLSAESFEGTVTMKLTSPGKKDGSQTMNMSLKDGYMRVDMNAGKGFGGMIMDFKDQTMTILLTQQQMYVVQTLPKPGDVKRPDGAPTPSPGELVDTGAKETILGYECTKFVHTRDDDVTDLWLTDQLGTFTGGFFRGLGRQQMPQAWEEALRGHNYFPLRVVTNKDGKEKFRLEVTAIQKTHLADSTFTAPPGWRKMDIGGMMGGARPSSGSN